MQPVKFVACCILIISVLFTSVAVIAKNFPIIHPYKQGNSFLLPNCNLI